ncbi:alpha-N-arabinofuranosidase A [Xylaria digitata]|nr:alpha-N-arabinofuranosidase A [Xylaria digitata]
MRDEASESIYSRKVLRFPPFTVSIVSTAVSEKVCVCAMAMMRRALFGLLVTTAVSAVGIHVDSKGGNVTGGFHYGLLHEDIDNSGDGGLYAELIRNRAFQSSERYASSLAGWFPVDGTHLSLNTLEEPLSEALSTSLKVVPASASGQAGFFNDGYWGIDVKVQEYRGSFWVRGDYSGHFTASLQSNITGEQFGFTRVESKSRADEWVEHDFTLTPSKNAPSSNNTFAITFEAENLKSESLDFNLISLFPPTYKGRKNGLRLDLVEALEGFHPTLFRIPGGNMLEGNRNTSYWDWKDSIGPLKDRPGFSGVWGYQQTHGLGLLEYLEFAEDMGMELVLAVYAGLSLNGDVTPEDQLQQFIDDALDEIEFIRGPPDSKWGAVRAQLGHPEPWKLKYVEIGNEDWLAGAPKGWETYKDYRFPLFLEAVNKAYPDIQVIASGSVYDGHDIPSPGAGDYHLYTTPDTWVAEFGKFDAVKTPHIIGEMASTFPNGGTGWGSGVLRPFPWWQGAVGEGVALIGYERNADRIIGAIYAPILRNMNRWQWSITMLQFAADPAMTTRSTSWYVWELMAAHPITETLPATTDFGPLYYVAGKNEKSQGHVFKAAVYNSTNGADVPVKLAFDGVAAGTTAELTVLTGPEDPYGTNDPFTGVNIVKTTKTTVKSDKNGTFSFSLPNLSVAVLDTKGRRKAVRRQW